MKKLLLTLTAFMLIAGTTNAQDRFKQDVLKAEKGIVQRNQAIMPGEIKKPMKARKKIQLADNEKILGVYDTDDVGAANQGLGLPTYPGNLKAATIIPISAGSKFDGGKIKAIRFGLCQPVGASRVFVIELTANGNIGSEVVSQEVVSTSAGWNMVELTTPYTIDASNVSGYLVGFDYTQVSSGTAAYPLSFVNAGSSVSPTYIYGNLGSGLGWYSMGVSYGNLSVQCIVEKEGGYPKYDLIIGNTDAAPFVKKGGELYAYTAVWSDGKSVPSNFTVGIGIDGNEVSSIDFNAPEFTDEGVDVNATVNIPADMATGEHSLSMYIKAINGAVPTEATSDDRSSAAFNVYTESMPRQKQLIEHFTSQYCTYCPLGISVLEGVAAKRNDIAWVSIHGDMQSGNDQYTVNEGNYVMSFQTNTYPSASFNRTTYPNTTPVALGIAYNASVKDQAVEYLSNFIDYTNNVPALASVAINTTYDNATRNLDIKVSGQTLDEFTQFIGSDAALTVYLTEDGLVAKQLNQGSWIPEFTHDNVLRKVVTHPYGDAMNMNGNAYENTYSVTLDEGWNKDNMHVVAFISRKPKQTNISDKLWVTNTEISAVKDAATGIDTAISNGTGATEVARYNANGVRLSAPQKGINIVKLSDGSIKKVIVE